MFLKIKKTALWIALAVIALVGLVIYGLAYGPLIYEEYVALTGRMRHIQASLLAYSQDHGGSDSRLILPESLDDLFKERYMAPDDFRGFIRTGLIEYRGRVPGVTMETPLIRGRMKSGATFWCAMDGPISNGKGW